MIDERVRNGSREDRQEHWHLSKSISLAHILTTVVVAAGAFSYAITQHERLTRLEGRSVILEERFDREVHRTSADLAVIRQSVTRMEDRLERFMERDR